MSRRSPLWRAVEWGAWLLAGAAVALLGVLLAERLGYPVAERLRALAGRAKDTVERELLGWPETTEVAGGIVGPPSVAKLVYLNREGATLLAGRDHAARNVSSIARAVERSSLDIPAFSGSDARWRQLVACVRERFAPFDVEIVDRRPVHTERYIMAVVGGTAKLLGEKSVHHHAIGLAPFNGEPIEDAVVLVFSGGTKNALVPTCDAAAMELAHAYGLDHAFDCRDVMTYLPACGPKSFVDRELRCGEHSARDCKGGAATQNAHRRLLELLGPR